MEGVQLHYVEDLTPARDFWNMKARIIRVWHQSFRWDVILIDERGSKIQACVKINLVKDFADYLNEDDVVLIKKFGVGEQRDKHRVINLDKKINFFKCTSVTKTSGFTGDPYAENDKKMAKKPHESTISVDDDLVPREAVEKWLKYLREELPKVAFKCSTQEQRSNLGWKSSKTAKKMSNLLQTSDCLGAETLIKLPKNDSRCHEVRKNHDFRAHICFLFDRSSSTTTGRFLMVLVLHQLCEGMLRKANDGFSLHQADPAQADP